MQELANRIQIANAHFPLPVALGFQQPARKRRDNEALVLAFAGVGERPRDHDSEPRLAPHLECGGLARELRLGIRRAWLGRVGLEPRLSGALAVHLSR